MYAVDSLCLEGSASKIQTSDQKYLKEILQACLRQTMFVLIPYFRHRVYTALDVIGS